ncbi:MAG: hypothetical protein LBQ48_00075 [Oscillospiraceae bacterium]|nr:hypothetical protein [Oscillospiraceae bacterium]
MKRFIAIITLVFALCTGVSAQTGAAHKHEQFDMLLGLNIGIGGIATGKVLDGGSGSFALSADAGVTFDFYISNYLSVNTGILLHPEAHLIMEDNMKKNYTAGFKLSDYAAMPLCISLPIMAHFNVPRVEWLYLGFGVAINIPLVGMLDSLDDNIDITIDTKGPVFVSLPIDIGFDLIRHNGNGMRFFFRITPTILEKGAVVPIGCVWQIYNWKIFK